MTFGLHTLHSSPGSKKRKKRIGRGNASGHGTYSTRGQKGQRARSGGRSGLKRKGMRQLLMSLPKMGGFKSLNPRPAVVNVGVLEERYNVGEKITPASLKAKGLVSETKSGVKILGDGAIKKKLVISGCAVSASAEKKIKDAGGVVKNSE